ncbi:MAG: TraX family protein [Deltaproteobacteria bacterium]
MSSFVIKVMACVFMLIDHVGFMFFPNEAILKTIGRLAFPLFAWQVSVGCKHTSNIKNYIARLCIFALISQIPFMLAVTPNKLNIFFTLVFGACCIYIYLKLNNKFISLFAILPIIIASEFLKCDYGAYGVVTIFLFYIFFDKKAFVWVSQFVVTVIYSLAGLVPIQIYSLIALGPISLYNGRKGPQAKYVFYIFYPAHLLVLYFIKRLV